MTIDQRVSPDEFPAQLFKLPYANDFYICTCAAVLRSECTCDQEHTVTQGRNRHTCDAALVAWLSKQAATFSIEEAIAAMGLSEAAAASKNRLVVTTSVHYELGRAGATYDRQTGMFTPPSAETLAGLHLRRSECSQSPTRQRPSSPALPTHGGELSPALHADHRPAPDGRPVDPQLLRQSV